MWQFLKQLLAPIIDFIKKNILTIITLVGTLIPFFKETPARQEAVRDPTKFAGVIQDAIDKHDYTEVPINFVYDMNTKKLVDYQNNTELNQSNEMDEAARKAFADKRMIRFTEDNSSTARTSDQEEYNYVTI